MYPVQNVRTNQLGKHQNMFLRISMFLQPSLVMIQSVELMPIAGQCMLAQETLARILAKSGIPAGLARNVLLKTLCLSELQPVFALMDFTLAIVASVFKVDIQQILLLRIQLCNTYAYHLNTVTGVAQCRVHNDCRDNEQCHTGSCIDACRIEQCGTNAICTSRDHSISCECPPGYAGDARVACYPSECLYRVRKRCQN